jgi:hypothetical protein
MVLKKNPGEWVIANLSNNMIPDPLPKLALRGPELIIVVTDDKCGVLLLFLFPLLSFFSCTLVGLVHFLHPLRVHSITFL